MRKNLLKLKVLNKLILGYFLKVLTNEDPIIDDEPTPGIPTLSAFEHFGEMLKNKYIYKEYIIWKNSNIQRRFNRWI